MLINFGRNKFKGGLSKETLTKLVSQRDGVSDLENFELDHIIPFCISKDNSMENLQLLSKKEHHLKTTSDFKILRILRELGYYEKSFGGWVRLLKSQKKVVEKFKKLKEEQV